ncbi:Phosphorylated CTD interacting factor 1 WW domain [Trypanosoma vivax]|uniref:PCIF1 WW domain-containing protein n=1 Tax=Trypanosoma vivax (strain Y486) TaxID=1055687 RepID=G0TVJ3_TRYVY|nr:hypothetical protein TRVL_03301 [Trypanosoma vivax]KAH8620579.1 Phosphorylated CTD interacting factor 1 WW domain [Trypanosoma vivax]CCC47959.1 conserved hypothetical protein [Trypanosoma vivax Y486]
MHVRTRREGFVDAFSSRAELCDITKEMLEEDKGCEAMGTLKRHAGAPVYSVQLCSRSFVIFASCGMNGACEDVSCSSFVCADDEVDRHRVFLGLSAELLEAFKWRELRAVEEGMRNIGTNGSLGNTYDGGGLSLLTAQVACELPARWVMHSMNEAVKVNTHRTSVTLLDTGATVRLMPSHTCGYKEEGGSASPTNGDDDRVSETLYRVTEVSDMADGNYWVEIEPITSEAGLCGGGAPRTRVDRDSVRLHPALPVHPDPLIPADEICSARGTSTCLFLTATLALQRLSRSTLDHVATWRLIPKIIATRMGHRVREAREKLWELCLKRRCPRQTHDAVPKRGPSGVMGVRIEKDYVTLSYKGLTVEILQRGLDRLSLLWDARASREGSLQEVGAVELCANAVVAAKSKGDNHVHSFSTEDPFFVRVFILLLRYRTFLGEMGYNQGPHAAVPPIVMKSLHDQFDIQCEAFASPLNSQMPQFASLFPDTDRYFGSIGAFFDLSIYGGHFEINPPFVTTVLKRLQKFLFNALASSDTDNAPSLLFVVVLPSHDLDDDERASLGIRDDRRLFAGSKRKRHQSDEDDEDAGNWQCGRGGKAREISADRAMRESSYCLSHTLCPANETAYVDGHQHVLRAPLFCIGSPTRLIVLGNRVARRHYSDAEERLRTVRSVWCKYTSENRGKEASNL